MYICCTYGFRRRRKEERERSKVIRHVFSVECWRDFYVDSWGVSTVVRLQKQLSSKQDLNTLKSHSDFHKHYNWSWIEHITKKKTWNWVPETTIPTRKHYVIWYFKEFDGVKSYFEVFQQDTLLLLRAYSKALNMEKSTGPCVNTLCNKLIKY